MPGHALALVSAVDPALLDLVELTLTGEDCLVIRATLLPELDDGVVRLTSWGHGGATLNLNELEAGPAVVDVPLPADCLTCSLREVLLAVAEDRANSEPDSTTVVLLPPAIELPHLVPGLAHDLSELANDGSTPTPAGLHLTGVTHLIDAQQALADLLDHHPLSELGLALSEHDTRCTGEVHLVNLGYADLIVSVGHEAADSGADLVEHLRPLDTLLLPGLDAPLLDCLLSTEHDADSALRRVHPATTQAWGGPDQHGVWTLDLNATLPFHPGRLREMVAELAGRGLCARGCFWLPSRPGRICAWEVVGGSVSVGDAGAWSEAPLSLPAGEQIGSTGAGVDTTEPHCHLVVTGVGDEAQKHAVEAAFAAVLLREDELADALAWIGAADGLEDWFGEEN
ncbi:Cobalamin synthesis protein cobW C-terminal domain [Actinomyces bovis]|uniref:Cobalamin synthesis protein cobW C-terminal domain n=1 Tax=Actinomyces bovis TaxID=1658 RepID=A0ABY1VMV9_9ACTO|nr:GTP-binding protein [Actinomyces bovis]SPT53444.1 Cobalamin synthesis protein cobW C-terminal domain [Actinomyces bovis]VEG52913.1 Cobalamin synthesis protein cobW C-terminal domain [Actinomyces israelii]